MEKMTKYFAIALAMTCSCAPIASAAMAPACVAGTLSDYIALGSGGCYIGNDQLSSFQALSVLAGSTAIAPVGVTVTPGGSDANPTLLFNLTSAARSNAVNDLRFTYQIGGNNVTGSMIALANTSVTADGAVTYARNLCEAGRFGSDGVSGCTGTAAQLVALNSGSDATTFPGVSFLHVSDDFTVDGGLSGSASGGQFIDQFTASAAGSKVPEPTMIPVLVVGMALAFYWKRRSVAGVVNNL